MKSAFLALVGLALAAPPAPPPDAKFKPFHGTPARGDFTVLVTEVRDGDSFVACLMLPMQIRLHGCDAPELHHAGGAASRDHLRGLILNKQVQIRLMGGDKYFGRTLGDVNHDGGWLSAAMIAAGQAKAYDGHGPRP